MTDISQVLITAGVFFNWVGALILIMPRLRRKQTVVAISGTYYGKTHTPKRL